VGGGADNALVRARHYVVACGGIHSPRLLLQSACERYPSGIGNAYGKVGTGFNEHPSLNFYAEVPHGWGTLTLTNKLARTHQFYGQFRPEGLGTFLPVFRQAWLLPHHVMEFRWSKVPRNVQAFLRRAVRASLFVGASIEMEIEPRNRVTLTDRRDALGNPIPNVHLDWGERDLQLLDRGRTLIRSWLGAVGATRVREAEITWSRHHQGTCRMGDNPATSVVDRNLRVHGMSNLYVCGCEAFVTGGAMQPCLTIVALAHRLADHLTERLKS
jgi:choline dehydrogenase-like flavoprotein